MGYAFAEPRDVETLPAAPVTSETVQQDGWLVPWPGGDDSSIVIDGIDQGGAADASPSDEAAESLDEALVAYRQARAARLAWRNAEKILAVAEQREANALASANTLTRVAMDKKAVADTSAAHVKSIAREAYIAGTTPDAGAFLANNTGEARDILSGENRVEGVLSFQIGESKKDAAEAVDAASKASQAVWEAQTIRSEVERLRALIDEQKQIEKDARAIYDAFMEDQGAQIEIGPDGCPTENVEGSLRGGAETVGAAKLCRESVREAATPQAALAIKYAFSKLGAPYACDGVGRMGAFRFDCSSLVSRAYAETVGIPFSADTSWAHSTRDMMPWGGVPLDPHYVEVDPSKIRPGDLLLFRSCSSEPCSYQHVTMALTDGYMLHTNSCGDVAHITKAPGYGPGSSFVVARRVTFLPGEEGLVAAMKKSPWLPPKNIMTVDDTNTYLDPDSLVVPDLNVDDTTVLRDDSTAVRDDTTTPIPDVTNRR